MTSWKTKYLELKAEYDKLRFQPVITDNASFDLSKWDMEIIDNSVFLTLKRRDT